MYTPQLTKKRTEVKEMRLGADGKLRLDGGINIRYDPTQINDNQSPYMPNMTADDRGELTKRMGQAYVYTTSLGAGQVNGIYERLFNGFKVFAWGTQMYRQTGSAAPVSIATGLTNSEGSFFVFNSLLYYINGTDYVSWDGAAAAVSAVVGKIPTLTISRPPAGGGTVNEARNFLQPGFKDSFSADGTSTAYQLSLTGLDATAVTAVVNGVAKAETTDFTVNRTTGVVTFTVVPTGGVANNVVITAYKTTSGYADQIKNNKYVTTFGGENDTRVFLAGNPNFKIRMYRSDVFDPTFFPIDQYQDVGSSADDITELDKTYDRLIIFKERSIHYSYYNNIAQQGFYGADGFRVTFPTAPLNNAIGCDMPGSIQTIDNDLVFGHSELGMFIIVSTVVKDERNVRPISGNINGNSLRPGLLSLTQSDLQAASSVDFNGKYILCIGNQAYVWDYRLKPFYNTGDAEKDETRLTWYNWTNINASCWMQDDLTVYYGDRSTGRLVTFIENYNDVGASIPGNWRSKTFNFNMPDMLKTIMKMWFTTRAGSYSSITINYLDENGTVIDTATVQTSSYSWARFTWSAFSFAVSQFPPNIRTKPRIKRVVYFAVEFSNNVLNENLSILNLEIQYSLVKKTK